jgi:hypothetical protein
MALNPLIIETDYFTAIQNRRGLMKAADFDFQFNNIVNYLNSEVAFLLRKLVADSTPGSIAPDKVNTYLHNKGDGTTEWTHIDYSNIPDYSVRYEQLAQSNPCSILACGVDNIFKAVSPTEDRQILTSQNNAIPVWKKINAANIEDRAIIESKIDMGSLLNENFQQDILNILLQSNSVTTATIADNTIPSAAIANNAVTQQVLGNVITDQLCGRNGDKVILWGNTLPDGFINVPSLIKIDIPPWDGFSTDYPIDYTKLADDFKIPITAYATYDAFHQYNLDDGCIESYQIKENSLDGNRLRWIDTVYIGGYAHLLSRDVNDLLEDGSIGIEHLPYAYRAILGL